MCIPVDITALIARLAQGAHQNCACAPGLSPGPHCRRRDPTPESCPLIFTFFSWRVYPQAKLNVRKQFVSCRPAQRVEVLVARLAECLLQHAQDLANLLSLQTGCGTLLSSISGEWSQGDHGFILSRHAEAGSNHATVREYWLLLERTRVRFPAPMSSGSHPCSSRSSRSDTSGL